MKRKFSSVNEECRFEPDDDHSESEEKTSGSEYVPSDGESGTSAEYSDMEMYEIENEKLEPPLKKKARSFGHSSKDVDVVNNNFEEYSAELSLSENSTNGEQLTETDYEGKNHKNINNKNIKKISKERQKKCSKKMKKSVPEHESSSDSHSDSDVVNNNYNIKKIPKERQKKCSKKMKKSVSNYKSSSDSHSDSDVVNNNYKNVKKNHDTFMPLSESSSEDEFKILKDPTEVEIEKSNFPKMIKGQKLKEIPPEVCQAATGNKFEESIESADSSINLSLNVQSVGSVLKNQDNEVVPTSTDGTKKNACLYCVIKRIKTENQKVKVLYSKLVEHYDIAHKDEKLIDRLRKIPKVPLVKGAKKHPNQIQRERILNYLRNEGNHYNNLIAQDAKDFVVSRRTRCKGARQIVSMFGECMKCKKYMSKASLRKHVRKCTGFSFKKRHIIQSSSRAMLGNYHEVASEDAIKIISKMRENEVLEAIRYDYTVFVYLNSAASQYLTVKRHHKKIRSNLSRLGTLKLLMMDLDANVKEFSDIFDENRYQTLITAVKAMGKPDPNTNFLQSPATASDMYHLIKDVAEIYDVKLGSKRREERIVVTEFLKALKKQWHKSLGNTIAESQAEKSRNKVEVIPTAEDTELLRLYLLSQMQEAYSAIKSKYTDSNYEKLRNALVSYLHLTNCRRAAEIEILTISEFNKKIYNGKKYRVQVRGKRTKAVPIVFDNTINKYLDLLINNRSNAKIFTNNPLIFSKIHDVNNDFSSVSATTLMTNFSNLCGAEQPELLRGTYFRKHAATEGMKRGLDDQGVEKLCGYLGHTSKIHHSNYRISVVERDISVSDQITEFQTTKTATNNHACNKNISKNIDKRNNSLIQHDNMPPEILDSPLIPDDAQNNNNTPYKMDDVEKLSSMVNPITRKKDKTSRGKSFTEEKDESFNIAMKKNSYTPWKRPQIKAFLDKFPQALDPDHKVPSAVEIRKFINESDDPIINSRTEPQIRTWCHTQRRSKAKNTSTVGERNHVPAWIYTAFRQYVQAGKIPSVKTCAKVLGNSPSKSNLTIDNLQKWVTRAIELKKKK